MMKFMLLTPPGPGKACESRSLRSQDGCLARDGMRAEAFCDGNVIATGGVDSLFIDEFKESDQFPCMVYSSKLTSKNQTTLPKAIVALLGAKPSSILAYEALENGAVLLTAKSATFQEIAGSFPKKRSPKPVSVEDMKKAAAAGAARRFRKAR